MAGFAQLERERVEQGLFPITLNPAGHIHGSHQPSVSGQLEAAIQEASARIEQHPFTAAEREAVRQFVTTLHQNAATIVTKLPTDLFAPVEPTRSDRREVILPDGEAGTVTVSLRAEIDPQTHMMREAECAVVTDLSGDLRRRVETWNLGDL